MPVGDKDDADVHFMALFSKKPNAIPILLLHGWPGSFMEFNGVLDALMERYTPEMLPYHVIVPSLPGWGFSSRLPVDRDFDGDDMHERLHTLMMNLGFSESGYVAQGGDIGSFAARRLAVKKAECKAVHCMRRKSAMVKQCVLTVPLQ
jgi:microsomal epoxide hydrolase